MSIRVRELPPLRHHVYVATPSGKRYRWGTDEPDPANVPSGLRSSSTMPGGFESMDVTLPRKAGTDYSDLERLSTLQVLLPGGDVVGEYRLERTPRVSGDQMAISPSAVGWQAHLADDKSARFIGISRDLGRWQGPSRQRQLNLLATSFNPGGGTVIPDATSGAPTLETGFDENGGWQAASIPISEPWYDAGDGNLIGRIKANWARAGSIGSTLNWVWAGVLSSDDVVAAADNSGNLVAAGPGTLDLTAGGSRRFAFLQTYFGGAGGTDQSNLHYAIHWTNVRVFGDHGLAIYGATAAEEGLLASDVVAYAVRRWAPLLNFTEGSAGTIRPSTFILPEIAFFDPTNVGEIVRQATRFGLEDWAVWEGKTFYWNARGQRGRNWRARIAPAQLEETGPQIDRLWESVIVQYRDVDGSTRTVGPPGSGAGTEDAALKDSDPDNPANQIGIVRRDMLQAGTLTAGAAIEIGRRFLIEQKLLDTSGRARLVGHVMDDHGVLHPYSRVRGGDTITFIDASDRSARRIVRADHDHDSKTCSVDLDAPPEGLQALLERLGVTLAPLGV